MPVSRAIFEAQKLHLLAHNSKSLLKVWINRLSNKLMYCNSLHKWTPAERRVWCAVLFVGSMCLYMSRNSLPLCMVSISSAVQWDKHQSVGFGVCITAVDRFLGMRKY